MSFSEEQIRLMIREEMDELLRSMESKTQTTGVDLEIAKVSNLITDITLAGGSKEDLKKAILYSKTLLDLRKAIGETDIEELIEKYSK